MVDKLHFIQKKAQQNFGGHKVFWSRHAIGKLILLNISRQEVEIALRNCELIEDYPALHRPLPDCLVLGWIGSRNPIHTVIAVDEAQDRIFVITVYIPDSERWSNDFKERK